METVVLRAYLPVESATIRFPIEAAIIMVGNEQEYWVYVAYPNQWVTVHRAECSHCRSGRGQQNTPSKPVKTDWFGPYPNREAAFTRAEQTKMKNVRGCGHCKP